MFGQDADRFLRYCSDKTLGKIWLWHDEQVWAFLDITLHDLGEWSEEGCALSRHIFDYGDRLVGHHVQSGKDSWVLGMRAYASGLLGVEFLFIQLKPENALQFDDESLPMFWSTVIDSSFPPSLHFTVTTSTEHALHIEVDEKFSYTGSLTIPRQYQLNTLSALPKARQWLETCINHHSSCQQPGNYVPTRLLSLSTPSKGPGSRVHLQLSSELGDPVPFSALSYCWGGDQQLKLENSSLDRFRTTGIRMEELPRTIADAVTVTLSLGIRHLWIDALCILQDSDEDKAREIGLMGKIYSAATVTLAVSSASSVKDGFLRNRSPEELGITSFAIPAHTTPGPVPTLATVDIDGGGQRDENTCTAGADNQSGSLTITLHQGPRGQDLGALAVSRSPLYQRAWTYQERVLSSRILDFGLFQTRWCCQESTPESFETFENDVDGGHNWQGGADGVAIEMKAWEVYSHHAGSICSPDNISFNTEGLRQIHDMDFHDQDLTMSNWNHIIELYTRRNLTFQEDRLPALSAIAQCFQARTGYGYAAGLWVEDMPRALLWKRKELRLKVPGKERKSNSKNQVVYCGPSWSWASVDDEVEGAPPYRDAKASLYGKVLELHIEPKLGGNIFGGLSSAALTFRGLVKPAFWIPHHDYPYDPYEATGPGFTSDSSDSSDTSVSSVSSTDSYVHRPRGHLYTTDMTGTEETLHEITVIFDVWRPELTPPLCATTGERLGGEWPDAVPLDVYLMAILMQPSHGDDGYKAFHYEGLVLHTTESGDYARLGRFTFSYDNGDYCQVNLPEYDAIGKWLTSGDEQIIRLV